MFLYVFVCVHKCVCTYVHTPILTHTYNCVSEKHTYVNWNHSKAMFIS